MKRLLRLAALAGFIILVNFTTMVILAGFPGTGGANEPEPCQVGDVDGNGSLQLADAVSLLNHLFNQGPAPVACATTMPAFVSVGVGSDQEVPLTGQVEWTVEYYDPCDLHDPLSSTITLLPGTWVIGTRVQAVNAAVAHVGIRVDGELHASLGVSLNAEFTTLVSVPNQPVSISITNEEESGWSIPGEGQRESEFWAIRIGD